MRSQQAEAEDAQENALERRPSRAFRIVYDDQAREQVPRLTFVVRVATVSRGACRRDYRRAAAIRTACSADRLLFPEPQSMRQR